MRLPQAGPDDLRVYCCGHGTALPNHQALARPLQSKLAGHIWGSLLCADCVGKEAGQTHPRPAMLHNAGLKTCISGV